MNIQTIRYYQRRGLLEEPSKPPGGYRRYPVAMLRRVHFIKRAQQLGFTLEEVKNLLLLEDGRNCREAQVVAEWKLSLIKERIEDLIRMRRTLEQLIAQCAAGSLGSASSPVLLRPGPFLLWGRHCRHLLGVRLPTCRVATW